MPKSKYSGKTLRHQIANIKVPRETYQALQEGYRIICHQGGTRSGKTYSIIQLLIGLALKERQQISVVSVAMPHLRRGAMRDWQLQMESCDLYDEDQHYKTEGKYTYPNNSYMEFFSVDEPTKVRGPGRDILFINEANLINRDTFFQLLVRTRKTIILDYNPADEYHWIYDDVIPRSDCKFIQSTYLDNPFLPKEQISEIERLKNIGGNYWQVYGLGERGQREGLIYPKHITVNEIPDCKVKGYGLDFGYSSDPTALIEVGIQGERTYEREIIYQTGLTNSDLISKMKALDIDKRTPIYADSAEPQRIEEIYRAGFNIHSVKKGPDSIKIGIDTLSRFERCIDVNSPNLIKEIKGYSWSQDKNGKLLDKPEPFNDHAMDAVRYFIHMNVHDNRTKIARGRRVTPKLRPHPIRHT